jgi:CHAT domain-containing protein/tetratricopeptide (TPR) repeat protein
MMALLSMAILLLALPILGADLGHGHDNHLTVSGKTYSREGDDFFKSGDNYKALDRYEKALIMYGRSNSIEDQGRAYIAIGNVHLRRGDNAKATEMFDKAKVLFIKAHSRQGEGLFYLGMGNLHLRSRSYIQALEMYGKALPLFAKMNDLAGQGNVYRNLGEIAMRTGKNPLAMDNYEKSLTCFSKAGDVIGQGNALRSMGEAHYYTGNNSQAMVFYDRALSMFQKTGYPAGEADVLRRKGQLYLRLGDNDQALPLLQNGALPSYRIVEDPIGQADAYKDIGDIYYYFRDYAKAMELYDKARPLYMKVDDPIGQGNVCRSMGDIFMRTGDDKQAAIFYIKAQGFYQRADSPIGQGNVYHSLGDMNLQDRDLKKAETMYRQALSYYEKANAWQGQGNVYRGLGDVALGKTNYRKALDRYRQALSFYRMANSIYGQGRTYQNMGDVQFLLGQPQGALEMYELSIELYRKMEDIELEAYALFKKAAAFSKLGNKDKALSLYETGLARLEKVRKQALFTEMKKGYLEKAYNFYEDAAVFMLDNHYDDRAFKTIEAMKARTFLDQLSEGQADLEKGIDPALRKRRDDIENAISLLLKKIGEEIQKTKPEEGKVSTLRSDLAREEERLEAIKREIRFQNPLYASIQYPEPITLPELQDKILQKDEALVEYFLTRQDVYCFVIGKDSYQVVKLPVTTEGLEKNIESLLKNIQDATQGAIFEKSRASILYEQLLKPLEDLLGEKTLIIAPHGKIAFLPFESLMSGAVGEEKYLIEKYRIKYVQSASVLGMLRTFHKQEGTGSKSFLGFGDPVYDYENYFQGKLEVGEEGHGERRASGQLTKRGYSRAGGRLSRLIGSGTEVKEIGKIFQENMIPAKILLRTDAREEWAKARETQGYGYIHFSTHGILGPKFQAIALAQMPQSYEDGFLTLGEIMNIRFNADLIVLSACETGLGHIDRGEGVTGLTRAVMYAGTPAAIVSLWSVSDDGTTELMILFYNNLIKKGMGKEESLRLAKIAMIKGNVGKREPLDATSLRSARILERRQSRNFQHPFFWAAFVMYGE